MLEVPSRSVRVPWRPTIVKVLAVLMLPIAGGYLYGMILWASPLIIIGGAVSPVEYLLFPLTSFLILLPGIFFERRMKSRPLTTSVRRSVIAATLIILGVPLLGTLFFLPIILYGPIYVALFYFPIVSISFFVILPLLNREFILRRFPARYHFKSYSELYDAFRQQFGRKRYLPLIIWSGLLFSPLISLGPYHYTLESLYYSVTIDVGGFIIAEYSIRTVMFYTLSIVAIPGFFLIFSLRFVFIRDLFRFNQGQVTQSRLLSMGILSEMAPAAILTLLQFSYISVLEMPFWSYEWILPTPLFPLLGYLFARMSRFLTTFDTVWEDEEDVMWFESSEPLQELGIKVPISYLILSKLRKLRR